MSTTTTLHPNLQSGLYLSAQSDLRLLPSCTATGLLVGPFDGMYMTRQNSRETGSPTNLGSNMFFQNKGLLPKNISISTYFRIYFYFEFLFLYPNFYIQTKLTSKVITFSIICNFAFLLKTMLASIQVLHIQFFRFSSNSNTCHWQK